MAGLPPAQSAPRPHSRGILHRRHCTECQRAYIKEREGIDVPAPPPPIEAGAVVRNGGMMMPAGGAMHAHAPAGAMVRDCPTCQGSVTASEPMMAAEAPGAAVAPGYAVVNGGQPGMMAANASAPGYAVVGEGMPGMEPSPIGVSRSGHAARMDPRMAGMSGPRPGGVGNFDAAVMPTSAIPPAQVAMAGPGSNRPHILGHLFGVPKFGKLRQESQDRERSKHAAIAYDQPNSAVTEVPASVVYGKGH